LNPEFLDALLAGIVPPFVLALLVLLPLLRRSIEAQALGGHGALALGFGMAAGVVFLLGGIEGVLHPVSVTQKLAWLGAASAVAGMIDGLLGQRKGLRAALRLLVPGALFAWLLRFQIENAWSNSQAWIWIPALALGAALLWTALDAMASRRPGPSLALAWAASIGATGAALAASRSNSLGQMAGALAAALSAALLVVLWNRRLSLSGLGAPLAIVLGGLLLAGHFAAELSARGAALCASGMILPAAVELLLPLQARPRLAASLRVALALAPPLLATWLAYQAQSGNPYY
jgi:hypothetical protein